ncbi:hypothetical protein [Crateriforma conspicua]|uniref:hypothetical protein n=1 Tax=Crateriforma conspicua TaxID=2527996 RepID=UPI00118B1081|nr:hypothetical protein [Crateriforma conspicua]QDV64975.1 hypothetical protein Mal65_41440 [Crateriforma conspicua]
MNQQHQKESRAVNLFQKQRPRRSTLSVVVDASDEVANVLVIDRSQHPPKILQRCRLDPPDNPTDDDSDSSADAPVADTETPDTSNVSDAKLVRQFLDQHKLRASSVTLLLTRPDVEIITGNLPSADDHELPEMVAAMVMQETDDGTPREVDFLMGASDSQADGELVHAVTCTTSQLQAWRDEYKQAGLRLESATYAGLGITNILDQQSATSGLSIGVSCTHSKTELVVVKNHRPVLMRTIQRGTDLRERLAPVLASELQRTAAYLSDEDDPAMAVWLLGDQEIFGDAAKDISGALDCDVSVLEPDRMLACPDDAQGRWTENVNAIGHLLGADFESPAVNLVSPKRPPRQPSPYRRYAIWGGVAASLLLMLGYFAWQDRSEQLDQIETKRETLKKLGGRANKAMELQDIVNAVASWRSGEVIWLDEIKDLSDRLPAKDLALVRRFSAQSASDGTGVFDLSLQVRSPEIVTELEAAIRDDRHSVSSKRVSEVGDSKELDWAFETRVTFQPQRRPLRPVENPERPPSVDPQSSESQHGSDANDESQIPRSPSDTKMPTESDDGAAEAKSDESTGGEDEATTSETQVIDSASAGNGGAQR